MEKYLELLQKIDDKFKGTTQIRIFADTSGYVKIVDKIGVVDGKPTLRTLFSFWNLKELLKKLEDALK